MGNRSLAVGFRVSKSITTTRKKYYHHSHLPDSGWGRLLGILFQRKKPSKNLSQKRGAAWGKRGGSVGEAWGKLGEAGVFSGEAHFLTLANAVFWGEAIGPSTLFKILNYETSVFSWLRPAWGSELRGQWAFSLF